MRLKNSVAHILSSVLISESMKEIITYTELDAKGVEKDKE